MRVVGTTVRSLRTPIFKEGDDIKSIVISTVFDASKEAGFEVKDGDILAITESVVARAQGNYATIEQIAKDVKAKFPIENCESARLGLVFPITSRNRFSILLKALALGCKDIVMLMRYPSDEVGNSLFDENLLMQKGVNPYTTILSEAEFREKFGYGKHRFTGIDYVEYFREIVESVGGKIEFVFSNNAQDILKYTENVLCCDIHSRFNSMELISKENPKAVVRSLTEILSESIDGSGFCAEYGLLGSNKANETTVKLFPRECDALVADIQASVKEKTGKLIEVIVYGDGAFKDPVGKIWELADPVVGVAYTSGLVGTPNEIKLKYLADAKYADLKGEELRNALLNDINAKKGTLVGNEAAEGTTPRQLSDLIGSLCDLTSGSGDKGTPVVYIQGYFDNYAAE